MLENEERDESDDGDSVIFLFAAGLHGDVSSGADGEVAGGFGDFIDEVLTLSPSVP